jgi:catechol 2,3-dioxygenase-like lactoylglutathione lyase family enzyme
MLSKYDATVTLAAHDMAKSRAFYTNTLGFTEDEVDEEGLSVLSSGNTKLNLYPSGSANVNGGTVCTWWIGKEFDEVIATLSKNGVMFEHYDGMPGMEREGDVHILTNIQRKVVWFKDPSGNILSIASN